jgi:hypothetical protein
MKALETKEETTANENILRPQTVPRAHRGTVESWLAQNAWRSRGEPGRAKKAMKNSVFIPALPITMVTR